MAPIYGHYCPVAHALEIVGDRWSLLIVRDLLDRPQRFTDLLHFSRNITRKWLTIRLRQLEHAGIVEREKHRDRREIWYKLTPSGQDLKPVIEALMNWGLRYAMRPPRPGEVVFPEKAVGILIASLNRRNKTLPEPASWVLDFTRGGAHTLFFNGDGWSATEGRTDEADVTVTISPEAWATFLALRGIERQKYAQTIRIAGVPEKVKEFMYIFGVRDEPVPQYSKQ
jgi:DNA-binding HxlR family transcriptional regulator